MQINLTMLDGFFKFLILKIKIIDRKSTTVFYNLPTAKITLNIHDPDFSPRYSLVIIIVIMHRSLLYPST
jgi:hypothetical protein